MEPTARSRAKRWKTCTRLSLLASLAMLAVFFPAAHASVGGTATNLDGEGLDGLLAVAGSTAAQLNATGLDSGPLLATSAVNGSGASTLKVDDDRVQCPDAQFTSIQAAVNASGPGATVEVCAGIYNESVVVDQRLHLKGWTQKPTDEQCQTGRKGTDPTRDSIVQGGLEGPGFWVQAHEVKITNFTVQLATNPGNGPGIYLSSEFSKYVVKENIIQNNVFGIYYNTNGAEESQVEVNCIRNNDQPGSANFNGIYSDQGLRNATVKDNNFTGHENASVILVGLPDTQSRLQIEANEIVDDASIILSNLTNSTVKSNVSIRSNGSGVFFAGGSSDVFVEANRIVDCAFTGVNVRFDPVNYPRVVASGPNTRITVKGNAVQGCGDAGIRLRDGTTASSVEGNKVEANGAFFGGITLEDAQDNLVKGNESIANDGDGLRADVLSADNRIEGNKFLDNGEHDCHDDSVGPNNPPALVANFWIGNEGRTQNRLGLCPNATVTP
jgi:nitrous oxidase accessory protein NosD